MEKASNYDRQGLVAQRLSNILAQILPIHQCLLSIKHNRLTEVLETLESAGFTGDLAIFFIAALQSLEARI